MEEDDEEVFLTCMQRRKNSIPGTNLYHSVQNSINRDSEQTLYHSVRNTLYEDAISMSSMHSAVSLDNFQPTYTDNSSTLNNDTNETIVDTSYAGTRNSIQDSRLVKINFFAF